MDDFNFQTKARIYKFQLLPTEYSLCKMAAFKVQICSVAAVVIGLLLLFKIAADSAETNRGITRYARTAYMYQQFIQDKHRDSDGQIWELIRA